MFDCKACVNNDICKYAVEEAEFKRLVDDFTKANTIGTIFSIEPICIRFKNAFEGIPRE